MNAPIDISAVVLQTERLTLRPWRETDLEDFYAYASVDGVGQMAGWTPHKDKAESQSILSRFIAGKHVFALEHRGRVIGSLGIEKYNEAITRSWRTSGAGRSATSSPRPIGAGGSCRRR